MCVSKYLVKVLIFLLWKPKLIIRYIFRLYSLLSLMMAGAEQKRRLDKLEAGCGILGKLLEMEKKSNQELRNMLDKRDERIREQEQTILDLKDMLEMVAIGYTEKLAKFDEMECQHDGLSRALSDVKGELKLLQKKITSELSLEEKGKPPGF